MAIELAALEVPIRVTGDTTAAGALRTVERAGVQAANRITAATAQATGAINQEVAALVALQRAGVATAADTARLAAAQQQLAATASNATLSLSTRAAAARQLTSVNAALGRSATTAAPAFAGLAASAGRVAAAFGAVLGVQAIAGVLRSSVAEATEAEQVWARLEAAVGAAGVSYAAVAPRIEAATNRIQASTRFDDEAAAQGLATLISITRDYEKSLAALPVVADLAIRAQVDFDTAAKLLGRAIVGQTETLTRYGIVIDKSKDALTQIAEASRGYATRDAATLAGALAMQRNQWQDIREAIGLRVLPAMVAAGEAALKLADIVGRNGPLVAGLVAATTAITALGLAAKALAATTIPAAIAAIRGFGVALAALALNPVTLAIVAAGVAIGGLTALMVAGYREANTFNASLTRLSDEGLAKVANNAESATGRLDAVLEQANRRMAALGTKPLAPAVAAPVAPKVLTPEELEAIRKAQAEFDKQTDALLVLARAGALAESEFERFTDRQAEVAAMVARGNLPLERRITLLRQLAAFEELTGAVPERAEVIAPEVPLPGRLPLGGRNLVEPHQEILDQLDDVEAALRAKLATLQQVGADIGAAMTSAVSGAITGLASAIGQGGNIAQAALAVIGRAAVQFGEACVAIGTAVLLAKRSLFSNPLVAIAAGATLIALGSALANAATSAQRYVDTGGGVSRPAITDVTRDITVTPRLPGQNPAVASASTLRPAAPVVNQFTVIGADDPRAQQEIARMVNGAVRAGYAIHHPV